MLRFATWKIISILTMTAFAVLVIVPSLLGPETRQAVLSHVPKWLPARAIVLGLDLQGGAHVLLEVDSGDVVKTMVDNLRDDVRRILREEKVPISGGIGVQPRGVQFRLTDPNDRTRLMPKLRPLTAPLGGALGGSAAFNINDNGSGLIQIQVTDAGVNDKVRRAVDQSIEVLRRRVDALGTTEPNIQRQGNDRILVEARIPPRRRAGRRPFRGRNAGSDRSTG
jgi:SecD/SecF fusion protein